MRVLLLIDMDSYFASVEQKSNPALRGRPTAVIGAGKRTVITTASYEARQFGVKTGMSMREAKKLCPCLVFVVGNNGKYTYTCEKLAEIYARYTSEVEVYSIDEAFLDITGSCSLFGDPLTIGSRIKSEIKDRFGLNATVGIGSNKLLAKLASDLSKPDGLMWIQPKDAPGILNSLALHKLWGIGRRTAEKLHLLGINTAGDLGRASVSFLRSHFGILGERLKLMGMGIDDSHVVSNSRTAQSISHSMTLPQDIRNESEVSGYVLKLSEMVGRRARKHALQGNTIKVVIRYRTFETFSRQAKITPHTNDTHRIYHTAMETIAQMDIKDPIRLLGVGLSGIQKANDPSQLPLLKESAKREHLLQTIDGINDSYGASTISWADTRRYASGPHVISPAWRPYGVNRTGE